MVTREAFIKQLEEDEDDETTRLVFSDWLEEHGETVEAERHRSWKAAKQWFRDIFKRHNVPDINIAVTNLIEVGNRVYCLPNHKLGFRVSMPDKKDLCDELNANLDSFWSNWSIVTGKVIQPEKARKINFYYSKVRFYK